MGKTWDNELEEDEDDDGEERKRFWASECAEREKAEAALRSIFSGFVFNERQRSNEMNETERERERDLREELVVRRG